MAGRDELRPLAEEGKTCIDLADDNNHWELQNLFKRLEKKEGVFQIYFTGCSGDVAMGKYNDRSLKARKELTDRLYAGMEASVAATKLTPAGSIDLHGRTGEGRLDMS